MTPAPPSGPFWTSSLWLVRPSRNTTSVTGTVVAAEVRVHTHIQPIFTQNMPGPLFQRPPAWRLHLRRTFTGGLRAGEGREKNASQGRGSFHSDPVCCRLPGLGGHRECRRPRRLRLRTPASRRGGAHASRCASAWGQLVGPAGGAVSGMQTREHGSVWRNKRWFRGDP